VRGRRRRRRREGTRVSHCSWLSCFWNIFCRRNKEDGTKATWISTGLFHGCRPTSIFKIFFFKKKITPYPANLKDTKFTSLTMSRVIVLLYMYQLNVEIGTGEFKYGYPLVELLKLISYHSCKDSLMVNRSCCLF
jgi:hypothetical protein